MVEVVEMKGGHAPAEKMAGGVRISRKPRGGSESDPTNNQPGAAVRSGSTSSGDERPVTDNVLAGTGLAAQTKKDFPEEAIRSYHEKPHAAREPKNQAHVQNKLNHNVFQPRAGQH